LLHRSPVHFRLAESVFGLGLMLNVHLTGFVAAGGWSDLAICAWGMDLLQWLLPCSAPFGDRSLRESASGLAWLPPEAVLSVGLALESIESVDLTAL